MKTIGLLTSGGDAPGMNACIRAIVRTCVYNGIRVMGIRFGFDGLIRGDIYEMNVSSVADIIQRGGTILGSARSEDFRTEKGQKKAIDILKDFGIDSVIVMGGDGSFRGAKELSVKGIKAIGIPCTIDNDMGYTDYTIGFYTAVETVVDAISKIRDTSSSHGRGNVIEVMGRHCGDIALYAGLAGGAESIVVPEIDFNIDEITDKVISGKKRGKLHHIIILAEGVGNAYELAKEVQEKTDVTTKVTVLGHIQRGGNPSAFDRLLASQMGNRAVKLLMEEKSGLALGMSCNKVFEMDLIEAVGIEHKLNTGLFEIARELSI
ncbi:6-phosphofructokinase [Microaceticoccus formicicus]|uniref:6-phosphofructokinase n=1 Tax=Microaceticoccus formicicus TaxID=3118105 RepID=UPI003CD04330|nr:6-phosphofructokinase [Peptoniphilaceae bacterium AMB_02]